MNTPLFSWFTQTEIANGVPNVDNKLDDILLNDLAADSDGASDTNITTAKNNNEGSPKLVEATSLLQKALTVIALRTKPLHIFSLKQIRQGLQEIKLTMMDIWNNSLKI